jgi:hypothetical protein
MRRSLLRLWLGSSVFGATLTLGCRHGERVCPPCASAVAPAGPADPLAGGTVPSSYRLLPAVAASSPSAVPTPSAGADAPPAASVRKVEWQRAEAPRRHRLAELAPPLPGERPAWLDEPVRRPVPPAVSVPAVEAGTHPAFAHAADYSWLVGYLQRSPRGDAWSVRYAAAEDDRHGGCLMLVGPEVPAGCRAGLLVRVEGQLVDPAPHEIKPAYRARTVQVLEGR